MNIHEARKLFPYLQNNIIYFNHASTAPLSKRILNQLDEYLIQRSENNIDDYKAFLRTVDETKNNLALLLNTKPDRFAFVDNTSTGLNILAQGIRWEKGDRIILNDVEFPSNVYPFLNLQEKGVEIDFVKSKNGIVTAEDIIDKIEPSTKLISVSFVQFLSGYKIDLEKLGKICKENDIIFSVDAIQGLGALIIDVEKCNIDFISCGTQKWMLGIKGFGFIYISSELQEKLKPAYVGWLSVQNAWNLLDFNLKLRKSADALQTGTINSIGIYALNASLKLMHEFGIKNIEENVLKNSKYFIQELMNFGIEPVLKECDESNFSGIVSFFHKETDKILNELSQKNIVCAVREGMVRFSPHFYNTEEEIKRVIFELKEIVNR